jgi:hypothetical protein
MSLGMISYVHHIISKDRYRVALPSDRINHWWVRHESQYALSWTTPTCIVIMTNASSNVAVGFPAIPRQPVTIAAMSIHFKN